LPLLSAYIPVSFLEYFISDQKIVGLRYQSRKSFLGLRSREIKQKEGLKKFSENYQ